METRRRGNKRGREGGIEEKSEEGWRAGDVGHHRAESRLVTLMISETFQCLPSFLPSSLPRYYVKFVLRVMESGSLSSREWMTV